MATRLLTQVYLEPAQKAALQARARERGTKVSEEIRSALDAYLSGIDREELELLDAATRAAEEHLDAMAEQLARTNRKLETVFGELDRLRAHRHRT